MPHLSAFRGLRYDPLAVPDLGAVLCPPYDVIDPARRQALAARHPRNAVHLELPVSDDGRGSGEPGAGGETPYSAAARLFAAWQADGTLCRDDRPMIYAYEQQYRPAGTGWQMARGFVCRLRVEEYDRQGVRRHERTHAGPREDRYQLLQAVRANLSPVLMLYDDGSAGAASRTALDDLTARPPDAVGRDDRGNSHALWAVEPAASDEARSLLAMASSGPLTIADGHHRYETALRYRNEALAGEEETPSEHVMVLLYEASSGGLLVLPTHRLLRGGRPGVDLLADADERFDVRRLAEAELLDVLDGQPAPGACFGVLTGRGAALVSAREGVPVDRRRGQDMPEALRRLPVAVLDAALEEWTGSPVAELVEDGRMSYTKEARAAVEEVAAGTADALFLLPSTPIAAVLEVAAAGEVMPQKSTYFEPKAATGLVFNRLSE